MLTGFYTIASGMMSQMRNMDVIGNNLVNIQTPGYRADRMVISTFEKELAIRQEANGTATFGRGTLAAVVDQEIPIFEHGDIKTTERAFDIAINGDGYFNIQGDDGQVYLTRGGQFDVDQEGNLILPGIGTVMGEGGNPLPALGSGLKVDESGEVYTAEGDSVGKILLTEPGENTTLVKRGNGMYQAVPVQQDDTQAAQDNQQEAQLIEIGDAQFVQGSLELSNVNMSQELTTYIEVQRAFQSCSSALSIIDAMNRKSATQIATI